MEAFAQNMMFQVANEIVSSCDAIAFRTLPFPQNLASPKANDGKALPIPIAKRCCADCSADYMRSLQVPND